LLHKRHIAKNTWELVACPSHVLVHQISDLPAWINTIDCLIPPTHSLSLSLSLSLSSISPCLSLRIRLRDQILFQYLPVVNTAHACSVFFYSPDLLYVQRWAFHGQFRQEIRRERKSYLPTKVGMTRSVHNIQLHSLPCDWCILQPIVHLPQNHLSLSLNLFWSPCAYCFVLSQEYEILQSFQNRMNKKP
jgi:hypothetical protein